MKKFWKVKDGDVAYLFVYVETTKKPKLKLSPMAVYELQGKLMAYQFRVVDESKEQIALFEEYGITSKDQVKEPRKRKDDAHN